MKTKETTTAKIDVLTSLRFFAAFVIVLYHAKDHFNCLTDLPDIVFSQGVTFFFILSGFILTYVYPKLDSVKEASFYFFKRLARIWPLHLSILFGSLLLLPKGIFTQAQNGSETSVFLTNLFMVQSWIPNLQYYFSYNSPSWSISTEMFFYLAFPLVLIVLRKRALVALVAGVILTGFMITATNQLGLPNFSLNSTSVQGLIAINPLTRLLEFICGMLIANLFMKLASSKALTDLKALPSSILEVSVLALCIGVVLQTNSLAASLGSYPIVSSAAEYWLKESGLPLIPFCLLIFIFALRKGFVSKVLQNPFSIYLGEISFAVYLCHYPLLKFFSFYIPQQRTTVSFVLFLLILIVTSHLLYKLVEMPSRSLLTKLYKNISNKNPLLALGEFKNSLTIEKLTRTGIEGALLLFLFVIVSPDLVTVSSAKASLIPPELTLKAENVKVGEQFKIDYLATNLEGSSVCVKMVLTSKTSQTVNHFISYQMLDRDGKELSFIRSRIAPCNANIKEGTTWISTCQLPLPKTDSAKKIAIVIAKDRFLTFSGARADMGGKRLLIPLENSISKSGSDFDMQEF